MPNISGNYQWFQDVGKITHRNENEIILSGIVLEITAKKQTEMLLMETIKKAEAATKAKSEFLANMSHEIRTPLNGVIGFTELLKETPLSQVQQQYVNNANVSGHTLLAIINDILDFSKIEAGMLNLEMINVDMVELLESVVDVVKYSADKKNLELLLHLDPEMPRYAVADPIRMKQILANLLGNAIKFTEKGEVELKVNYQPLSDRRGKFSFFVRDTGIGITEEQKGKLFKAFSQADSSTTRKFGGTGLGLIISDLIVQIMGSKINIDSKPGDGSTFYFDIITDVEKGEKLDKCSMDKIKRCLIIDDNANNRLILEKMLASWGIAFESSNDGLSALKLLETSKPFDVIICDYNMPSIDGLETIRMIRENLKLSPEKQPVILMHSSSDNAELHQKCEELGVRFRLIKPVKGNDLHAYLCQIYGLEQKEFKPAASEFYLSDLYSNDIKILIAEDVAMNMIMMKAIIGNILPSAQLLEASSGSKVLKLVKQEMPDLIFMDVHMPEMDGLDATIEIRKIEQNSGAHVPIVALTAGAFEEEKKKCLSAGMDDFLTKPVEAGKIRAVLAKYFVKKHDEMENIKFSKDSVLKKLNGNTVVLREFLSIAVTDLSKHINLATEAFEKNDIEGIRNIVHGIKGIAYNLDCSFVVDLAKEIEGLAASGSDLLKVAPKFKELISSLKILKDMLAE